MFRFLFVFLFSLLFSFGCNNHKFIEHHPTIPIKTRTIHWVEYSDSTFSISESSQKPILLYFSNNDPICGLMQEETMKDIGVIYFINHHFMPIMANDKLIQYEITHFPTILVLSSTDRTELVKLERIMNSEELLTYLKLAIRLNHVTETIDVMGQLSVDYFGLSLH